MNDFPRVGGGFQVAGDFAQLPARLQQFHFDLLALGHVLLNGNPDSAMR